MKDKIMKRLFLLPALLLALTFSVNAQILNDVPRPQTTAAVAGDAVQAGNWIIGGTIGDIALNFKAESFGFNVNPRAGYFISDNAALGAEVQLGLDIYDGGEIWRYGVTPFIRYYFPEGAAPTHRWFGEAIVGLGGSSVEDSDGDAILSRVYGLRAGYAHFVAEHVALEAILGYTRSNADISVGVTQAGLGLGIGLQIYLPGRNNR